MTKTRSTRVSALDGHAFHGAALDGVALGGGARHVALTRPEIQALRAAAVLGVVLFHLWPLRLTGGYAGVDVFFVISGFLITGHLVRRAADGDHSLTAFWARRARRLLPAAFVVIIASALLVAFIVPSSYWRQWLLELGASAVYLENWVLAASSTNYWAAGSALSPAQHYWSLSVEEQFYLVWPLLILGGMRLWRRRPRAVPVLLAGVVVLSLAYSIVVTASGSPAAYFVTPARVWEFGIGGLLALLPAARSAAVKLTASLIGWGAIVGTFLLYTSTTPFPGVLAAVPVLGCAAVIWGRRAGFLAAKPVQWIGDISYSLYLWHWPQIVIGPFALNRELGTLDKVGVFALSVILAALTKALVEDPLRASRRSTRSTLLIVGIAMVLVVATTGAGLSALDGRAQSARAEAKAKVADDCFGAAARLNGCTALAAGPVVFPELSGVLDDIGDMEGCYAQSATSPTLSCAFGSERVGALRVAVVGNSHAELWVDALKEVAATADWHVDSFIGRGGVYRWTDATPDSTIRDALQQGEPYDVVLVSYDRSAEFLDAAADPRAPLLAAAWKPVIDRGTAVIAIADNPNIPQSAVDCELRLPDLTQASVDRCAVPRSVAFQYHDALRQAVDLEPEAHLVTLDDFYCDADTCPVVIGNVVVYRDTNHLTATYVHTLVPHLMDRVNQIVDR